MPRWWPPSIGITWPRWARPGRHRRKVRKMLAIGGASPVGAGAEAVELAVVEPSIPLSPRGDSAPPLHRRFLEPGGGCPLTFIDAEGTDVVSAASPRGARRCRNAEAQRVRSLTATTRSATFMSGMGPDTYASFAPPTEEWRRGRGRRLRAGSRLRGWLPADNVEGADTTGASIDGGNPGVKSAGSARAPERPPEYTC